MRLALDWLQLALLALDLVRWIEREKLKTEAERAQLAAALQRIDANVAKADAARARVRAELDADPGGLRDDRVGPWRQD